MICNSNSMPMAFPILHARLLLLFVLPSWPLVFSQANREIHLGSSLVASDNSSPWRSPSGEFAFGFYQLGNQNLFLLAIWFDKIPEKTLAWYANGDNPAPEGSKVELTSDGQLILNDPKGDEIWRPQTTLNGVTHAYMLDAGNFALVNGDQNSTHVWESFKNPADTVLPTQVLEIGGTVSSRQAESNYSKGRFQLRLLPDGNLVLNTFDLQTNTAYDAYYWSKTYDAANRSNSGERVIFDESGRLYVVLQSGENVILKSGSAESTGGYYYRATLDFDLPWFEFQSLPLPLVSRFRAEPDPEVSPASLRRISSARIKSRISLYLSFSFPVELLTAILIASQLFGKEAKTIRARISSSKSISTDDN